MGRAGAGRDGSGEPAILFADDQLVAVDKPSGLAVHRGWDASDDPLVERVRRLVGDRALCPIHRLDRGTSGVVLFARSPEVARRVQRQLTEGHDDDDDAAVGSGLAVAKTAGRATKRYLALVRGAPPDRGDIDWPIPRREGGPRVAALTAFTRLATVTIAASPLRERRYSLVAAEPRTGRLHQVRRHLKHIGHPVLGDANYGRLEHNRFLREAFGLARLALHAACLQLVHPTTGAPLTFVAAVPDDLTGPLARMGFAPSSWQIG